MGEVGCAYERCRHSLPTSSPATGKTRRLHDKYYNFADCNPPSHTVIQNFECSTALFQGSINGYVQGQIQLGINYGIHKAFSPSEPFQ